MPSPAPAISEFRTTKHNLITLSLVASAVCLLTELADGELNSVHHPKAAAQENTRPKLRNTRRADVGVNKWDSPFFPAGEDDTVPLAVAGIEASVYVRHDHDTPDLLRDEIERVLLFGSPFSSSPQQLKTWVYTPFDKSWFRLPLKVQPPARTEHILLTMCLNRVVLFGGRSNGHTLGDTWIFNGIDETWGEVIPVTGKAPDTYFSGVVIRNSESPCRCLDSLLIFGQNTTNNYNSVKVWELQCVSDERRTQQYGWFYLGGNETASTPIVELSAFATRIDSDMVILWSSYSNPNVYETEINGGWTYDIKARSWHRFSINSDLFMFPNSLPRRAVYCNKTNEVVFIVGNMVFGLTLASNTWRVLKWSSAADPLFIAEIWPVVVSDAQILMFRPKQERVYPYLCVWTFEEAGNGWGWRLIERPPDSPPVLELSSWAQVGKLALLPVSAADKHLQNVFDGFVIWFHWLRTAIYILPIEELRESMEGLRGANMHKLEVICNDRQLFTFWYLDIDNKRWWKYTLSSSTWHLLSTSSSSFKDSGLVIHNGVRGLGISPQSTLNYAKVPASEVSFFDLSHRRLLPVRQEGYASPSPRITTSMVDVGNGSILLFGGMAFHPDPNVRRLVFNETAPRILYEMFVRHFRNGNNSLILLNDLWMLNLEQKEYNGMTYVKAVFTNLRHIKNSSRKWPPARAGHTLVLSDSKVFMFGGISTLTEGSLVWTKSNCSSDLWYYDLKSLLWIRVEAVGFNPLAHLSSSELCRVVATAIESRTLIDVHDDHIGVMSFLLERRQWIRQSERPSLRSRAFLSWTGRVVAVGHNEQPDIYKLPLLQTKDIQFLLSTMNPGCHSGFKSEHWATRACFPCREGTYAEAGSETCRLCPKGLSTRSEAAESIFNCSCDKSYCSHGSCVETAISHILGSACVCNFGYAGDRCRTPSHLIIASSSIAGVLLVSLLGMLVRKLLQYRKQKQQREAELEEMGRVWTIQSSELKLLERIDIGTPGSYGDLYKAQYRDMYVAVKKLKIAMQTRQLERDFEREILVMRTIRHPNIVLFIGAGTFSEDHSPFLVIEFMHRGALSAILHDRTVALTKDKQLSFCLHAARGVEFLHEMSPVRIHRDIKSSNLLVSDSWQVKVADFGCARLVKGLGTRQPVAPKVNPFQSEDSTTPLLQANRDMSRNVGAVFWRAPEIFAGDPYGTSADVYSFGIVMWEVMARELPYEDRDFMWVQEVGDAVKGGVRPTMPVMVISSEFADLMKMCWATEPIMRPNISVVVRTLESMIPQDACGMPDDSRYEEDSF